MAMDTKARGTASRALALAQSVTAVVRGASPGQDAYSAIVRAVQEVSAQGGGVVLLPKIGGSGYTISQTVEITSSNVHIVLGDDVTLSAVAKASAFVFTGASRTSRLSNVSISTVGGRKRVDGNARNVAGYTYSTADTFYSCVLFKWCDDWRAENVYGYNGLVNCLRAFQCGYGVFNHCDASDAVFDNGISIDFDPSSSWSDTDPQTWSNAEIVSPRTWNCAHGFGVTSYSATGVTISDPVVWNCGNDDPAYTVSGGGISAEGDYFSPGTDQRDRRVRILRPKVTACYNAGLFITAKGTYAERPDVQGTIAATNRSNTNTEKGSNFCIVASGSLAVQRGSSRSAGTHGVTTLADGFTVTATTTSGSDQLVVTSIPAGRVMGGSLSGTGIPGVNSVPGGTTILSGPAGGGAGTYTMSRNATASGSVTVTCAFLPSLEWDGEVVSPAQNGIYGRGFSAVVTSPDTEVRFAGSSGVYLNSAGGAQYGQQSNFARISGRRFLQTNDRAVRIEYSGRAVVDDLLIDTCRLTAGQGSQVRVENTSQALVRNIRNIDPNFNTSQIVYLDTTVTTGEASNISGDTASAFSKVLNLAATKTAPSTSGVRSTPWVKTADTTIANSTTAATLLNATSSLVTIQADTAYAGREYEFEASGVVSTLGASPGNLTFAVKLGSTTIGTIVVSPAAGLAAAPWSIKGSIVIRSTGASGSVQASARAMVGDNAAGSAFDTAATINTTTSQTLDLTGAWATASASNTITCRNAAFRLAG